MVTTIQISEDLRDKLQKFKTSPKTSYDDVIESLVRNYETSKEKEILLLKESYIEMYGESKNVLKEWESTDDNMPW